MRRKEIVYVSESTVYRVLKENNLIPSDIKIKPPMKKTEIRADKPNVVWRTDLSYIKVGMGHCYLITVLDKYSRKIIYHQLCFKMTTKDWQDVIAKALDKVGILNSTNKPILISDNGTYARSVRKHAIDKFVNYYNEKRLHQALGYVTPEEEYQGIGEKIRLENSQKLKASMEERKAINRQRRKLTVKLCKSKHVA